MRFDEIFYWNQTQQRYTQMNTIKTGINETAFNYSTARTLHHSAILIENHFQIIMEYHKLSRIYAPHTYSNSQMFFN